METATNLRILALQVSDFKKIEVAFIEPESGSPVIISGDNAAGKSSILDAILLALQNTGTSSPVRQGASKAKIVLKLGKEDVEFIVERTITAKGESLIVKSAAKGAQVPKAQTFLDSLLGCISIDPMLFMAMNAKQQALALQDQLGLTARMQQIDAELKEKEEERKIINRDVKALDARAESIAVPAGKVPDSIVDVAALMEEANECRAIIDDHNKGCAELQELDRVAAKARDLVAEMEVKLTQARSTMESYFTAAKKKKGEVEDSAPDAEASKADIARIESEIRTANATNDAVRSKREKQRIVTESLEKARQADALTKELEDGRQSKIDLVKNSPMPVAGLELTDEGLVYDKVPLADLNTAARIKVCAAISMANPGRLRVLFIREGALINRSNLGALAKLAEERGFQIWMECFSEEPRQDSIHIVEGQVASIKGQPVDKLL